MSDQHAAAALTAAAAIALVLITRAAVLHDSRRRTTETARSHPRRDTTPRRGHTAERRCRMCRARG